MDEKNNEKKELDLEYKPSIKPSLYDIHRSFDTIATDRYAGLVGEEYNRMTVFTNWVLGRRNVLLTGTRSSGKSNLIDLAATFARNPMNISLASEKADFRDQTKINKASHLIIPEINKASKTFIEVLKDLGEGKESVYKTLDERKNPLTLRIKARPFITSIADENSEEIGEELLSRMTTLKTDSTVKLNKEVIDAKLERAQNPYKKHKVDLSDVREYQKYVKNLPDINNYTFIYPMGKSVKNAIPPLFTDSRRDCDKYLSNTFGITLFHRYDRIAFKKGGKNNLIVAPIDVWYNHIIYGDVLLMSALKCSDLEKMILDILTRHAEVNPDSQVMRIKDIHKALIYNGVTPMVSSVEKYCDALYKHGYLIRGTEYRSQNYEVSAFFKNQEHKINIDWKKVIEESKESIKEHFQILFRI